MVKFDIQDDKLICHFSGHLDSANVDKWETWLSEKIEETKLPVVFDLEKVHYVASGFLRICIKTAKEVGKDKLVIKHVNEEVSKVFKLSGLDKQLKIK